MTERDKAAIIAAVLETIGDDSRAATLAPLLLARPPASDLAAFEPSALGVAARVAAEALAVHTSGNPVVRVVSPQDFSIDGTSLDLVTVVSDDMPFLFDSLTAEIGETRPEIHYISHPILDVRRGLDGRPTSFAASHVVDRSLDEAHRTSLIQFAISSLPDEEARAGLASRLASILHEVGLANADFGPMKELVTERVEALRRRAASLGEEAERTMIEEAANFLEWLRDENFIFLGAREYDYLGGADGEALERRGEAGLGILRDPDVHILGRAGQTASTTPEIRAFLEAPTPLIVTKANARSRVHRHAYMDYVGIKEYDEAGRFCGEMRIVGLFTSAAYTRSILTIPYLRLKAETVIARSGLRPASHSGKALLNTLEAFPRDEFFQIDVDLLERFAHAIVDLGERPRVRVLARVDRFDRFVSALVHVPRERYDSRLRIRIGQILAEAYEGHVSAYYPAFPEGLLARVHFIIGRGDGPTPEVDVEALESRIAALARNWDDAFEAALVETRAPQRLALLASAMPDSYRDVISPEEAVTDAGVVDALAEERPLHVDFHRRDGDGEELVRFKIYHLGAAVGLSTRVPILENMGFSAISERTFRIDLPKGGIVYLHDMELRRADGGTIPLEDTGAALEATFAAVYDGRLENDEFNALVLRAGLDLEEANVLRAYGRYLRQAGLAYSQGYLAAALLRYPEIAARLWTLFERSFAPGSTAGAGNETDTPSAPEATTPEERQAQRAAQRGVKELRKDILDGLDAVASLDDDRILRRFLGVILATLRTNHYALPGPVADEEVRVDSVTPALAFKIESPAVDGLPAPVPFREIFVFDARVEGVHLRFGKVARGGLRWSDRAQDYRTEVLGLVKAQQVKNAVIVPVGAKGGFFPKRLPDASDRDAWFEAGRAAYIIFIASLISVTDNIEAESVEGPPDVLRHDGDDPYFVVAADKGTATFSDTANAIAQARGFWLDDAFASGGSAGYDHKAMGITARGGWEAVKRHFRELGREGSAWDIQETPFTAAGCGDMSGDVFGNGMLLSDKTRLVAAFDHRDIFIDPDPDPETSFAERRRLFDKPRSSWQDYDREKLSPGGGVFSRRDKVVTLSGEAARAIGFDRRSGSPNEIIAAILKAPVDLFWFGGIGTYVRASSEPNAEVGDRSNDAVRVTASELRAKVVGEGANLGVTQRARIEFARHGGRINSDAIDNSAGVNTSDVEVNIKIALKSAMQDGRLERDSRNALLAEMTEEVAELVLSNNYEQTLAISLEEQEGAGALPLQARFMTLMEGAGELDRTVETLPSDAALADLRGSGQSLTRPEIGVLLAYAKLTLFDDLVGSDLPDDPYLEDRLLDYFPLPMRRSFARDIEDHRLGREIISTVLANETINRTGPTFLTVLGEASGAAPHEIVRAFVAAHDGLDVRPLYERIDALDGAVPGTLQNALYGQLGRFLKQTSHWFVRNERFTDGLTGAVVSARETLQRLRPELPRLATDAVRDEAAQRRDAWIDKGIAEDLAAAIAELPITALVPDIAAVSRETSTSLERTVSCYFGVTRRFGIGRLEAALHGLQTTDYYETLALERAGNAIAHARRRLTVLALSEGGEADDPAEVWARSRGDHIARVTEQMQSLAGSGETSVARITVAAGLLRDLVDQASARRTA